jgi:hypothetical protein
MSTSPIEDPASQAAFSAWLKAHHHLPLISRNSIFLIWQAGAAFARAEAAEKAKRNPLLQLPHRRLDTPDHP